MADPLSCWIESMFGIRHEGDRLVRAVPLPVTGPKGVAEQLSAETGLDETVCAGAIREYLMAGNRVERPDVRHSGVSVSFASVHQPRRHRVRIARTHRQKGVLLVRSAFRVPDSNHKRVLLPLVFCRMCGQDYYIVHKQPSGAGERLVRRDLDDNKKRDRSRSRGSCT